MIIRGTERLIPTLALEIRARLLREAAVGNIGQWVQSLIQPCRVQEESLLGCKLLFSGDKNLAWIEGTRGISHG